MERIPSVDRRCAVRALLLTATVLLAAGCGDGGSATGPDPDQGVPWNSSIAYGKLVDPRDGKTYRTVEVGGARWMAQDLDHAVDGSWCFQESPDSCAKYGRLYTWSAAMGIDPSFDRSEWTGSDSGHAGICPTGWHVPRDSELVALISAVYEVSKPYSVAKGAKSTSGWYMRGQGSDDLGLRVLPAGFRTKDGAWDGNPTEFRMWTASQGSNPSAGAWSWNVTYQISAAPDQFDKREGHSVRCVED